MKTKIPFLLIVANSAFLGFAGEPAKTAAPAAESKSELSVTRYTELPLSDFQRKVMNEATKLSYACRYFRGLYGRWPKDLAEIQNKTEGIDYGIFLDRASVTPLEGDAEKIQIFDGKDVRAVRAVPVQLNISDAERSAAQKPGYKIKL